MTAIIIVIADNTIVAIAKLFPSFGLEMEIIPAARDGKAIQNPMPVKNRISDNRLPINEAIDKALYSCFLLSYSHCRILKPQLGQKSALVLTSRSHSGHLIKAMYHSPFIIIFNP